MISNEIAIKCIALSIMPGFGPVMQNRLISICGSVEEAFISFEEELQKRDQEKPASERIGRKRIHGFVCNRDSDDILNKAKAIYQTCESHGIDAVTIYDDRYPQRFRNLDDMPLVLYIKGNLKINSYAHSVGVVGARRCSQDGKSEAISEVESEVMTNSAIISGMAKGIDSYAHTAAIKNDGYTIAVLGGGVDICYPSEHRALYDRISERGCIMSEYPPGTTPRRYMFPKRNRLIAALSDRLYVIDVGRNSGTETTVAHAERYGREVVKLCTIGVCHRENSEGYERRRYAVALVTDITEYINADSSSAD